MVAVAQAYHKDPLSLLLYKSMLEALIWTENKIPFLSFPQLSLNGNAGI